MKLCITGSFGNEDIGDDAMLTMHLMYLEASGIPKSDITLVGHKPQYMSWQHEMPVSQCKTAPGDPNGYDALLVTGGGTINTRDAGGASLKRMHGLVMPFAKAGKPIFMSGQTIGPLGVVPEHDKMAKEIIEAVDVLTVRDQSMSKAFWPRPQDTKTSAETIWSIKAKPKKVVETIDDAVDLPVIQRNGGLRRVPFCAFNVSPYTADTPEHVAQMARLADKVPLPKLMIPHHPVDVPLLRGVAAQMKTPFVHVDTSKWNGVHLKSLIADARCAIGARYHFIVFAGTSGVPFVGLAGNEYSWLKQRGFARQIGLDTCIWQEPYWEQDPTGWFVTRGIEKAPMSKSFGLLSEWLREIG